jgi:hypothetical protein
MMIAFVSSPYTHPDAAIQDDRATAAGDFSAWLWRERGLIVVSPIAHWHWIAKRNHLPGNAMAWAEWNRAFVGVSHTVFVLCLPGWKDSQGIAMEIEWAKHYGIPVKYAKRVGNTYAIADAADV